MTTETLVLLLGIISSTTLIISALSIHRRRLLLFAIATTVIVGTQYGLVGSEIGLAACVLGLARNLLVVGSLKYPWLNHWSFIPIFVLLHLASFMVFTDWNDLSWISFIPLVGGWLGVIAVYFTSVLYTKAIFICVGAMWMIYEFDMALYGQMIGEGLTLVANTFAFFALLNAARRGVPQEQIEDLDTHLIETITTSIPIIRANVESTLTNTIRIIHHDKVDEPAKHSEDSTNKSDKIKTDK